MRYAILPVVLIEEEAEGKVQSWANAIRRAIVEQVGAGGNPKVEAVLIVPIDTGAFVTNILGLAARSLVEAQLERPRGLASSRRLRTERQHRMKDE